MYDILLRLDKGTTCCPWHDSDFYILLCTKTDHFSCKC